MEDNIKNKILYQIKLMLKEIYRSARWNDLSSPLSEYIIDIGERVNSPESLKMFRKDEDLRFLLEIADTFEEYFNDDWLPDKIFGLKLSNSRVFLENLLDIYDDIQDGEWRDTIQEKLSIFQ